MKIRTRHQFNELVARDAPDAFVKDQIEAAHIAYDGGDKRQLAIAIQLCAGMGLRIPEWAALAFNAGLRAMIEFEAKSWDDILGGNPTGKRLLIARKNRKRSIAMVKLLGEIEDFQPNNAHFASLAERIGLSTTTAQARKLYYLLPEDIRIRAVRPRPHPRKRV